MADIKIKITNLPQIRAAFKKAPKLMTNELNRAISKTVIGIQGQEFVEYRALGIRVISRGLITSITRGVYIKSLYGEVGPNVTGSPGVPYAGYVHSGTRYLRARPFLLHAVDHKKDAVDKYFTDAVNNVLNQIGRET